MQSKHLVYLFGGYVVATLCEMSQYACVCVCMLSTAAADPAQSWRPLAPMWMTRG